MIRLDKIFGMGYNLYIDILGQQLLACKEGSTAPD